MNVFRYERAQGVDEAVAAAAGGKGAAFVAGGTNLLDLMKMNVASPERLVDINRLPLTRVVPTGDGGLLLGALMTNADTAANEDVSARYPLLTQAILAGASPQLRNMATNGGNLFQRTRCYYFYERATPCNKREPGSGCSAKTGVHRIHAILGASDHCIAVHPSDMCVALAALGARLHVQGSEGTRTVAFAELHRLPGNAPERDHTLEPGTLVTGIELPADAKGFSAHSSYLKIRDRKSYAFALVSVAAALELEGNVIRRARLALGGVAHKPWRDEEVERFLVGVPAETSSFEAAAAAMLRPAVALRDNAFKVELARRAIVRALESAAKGTVLP